MDPFIIALMEDGLLADWTENDGNELMDSDEEEVLLIASRRADQQGGNPLFSVNMERIQPPRSMTPSSGQPSQSTLCCPIVQVPN